MKYRILSIGRTKTTILPPSYRTDVEAMLDCDRLRKCPDAIGSEGAWFSVVEDLSHELKDSTVECSFCHKEVMKMTAHIHQGNWVGDECCWTEQLRNSE